MQERTPISTMDLKTCISNLRKNSRFTEEMIQLVQEDLSYGLTKEETEEYTGRKLDYKQMKVYSQCLRNGYDREAKDVIAMEGLSGEQMAVALEFYEKGISLDIIKEAVGGKENTAFVMKKLFQEVLSKMQEAGNALGEDELYGKELLGQIKTVVARIEYQDKKYEQLNEKLKELQVVKEDTKVQNNLLQQLMDKDGLLELQQNEINEAKATIARLRNDMDSIRREKDRMESRLSEISRETENNPKQEMKSFNPTGTDKREENEEEPIPTAPVYPNYPEMNFQTAFFDKDGRIIQTVMVEKVHKKSKGLFTALASRIFLKKKVDIVRLVAEKDLSPKQLIQVRNAMEKGLSDEQLMVLINHKIPEEQMEEIINIAVYENSSSGLLMR